MLILSSNSINAFLLSAGDSPKEEHLCMRWTLGTRIQLTLVGFPTSPTSAHANARWIQSKHRHDPDTAELPLPPAAEDRRGAAVDAIHIDRV